MKVKTFFLFVCVSVTCLVVQFGFYRGIVKGAMDPCPQTTTKTSIPCPYTGQLIGSCEESVNCNGQDFVFYSAEVKNTDYQDNKPNETYTTSVEYGSPDEGYQCATHKWCVKFDPDDACTAFSGTAHRYGKLYTVHNCND
jgi:hypothetical protein